MSKAEVPMTKSGHCAFPSFDGVSHKWCRREGCVCKCHTGVSK